MFTPNESAPAPSEAEILAARERLISRVGDVETHLVVNDGGYFIETLDGQHAEPVVVVPTPSAVPAASSGTPLGEAGYKRLMELLANPPVDVPGLPPPGTEVPEDLKDWLEAFKEPLVYMTVAAAESAVKAKLGGYSRGRLKELYAAMSPADLAAVMQGNAAIIRKLADQRAAEAAMIQSIQTKLVDASASLLLKLLAFA